ncbi:hypothetical protein BKA65DRAFT_46169 [Rhexocercosporidium sp. MPI-PUGE-AT-0058]|nr:hypothetical protein BKA65DRAFT_46169 [Rhexocercosporidium sp. MPI-PUGE-AT-0058]
MSGNIWQLATDWGFLMSGDAEKPDAVYNAGRINDALRLDDGTLLVASDTSGVWIADDTGGAATPLFRRQTQPNLRRLCLGPLAAKHVYAGGEFLWETDIRFSPIDLGRWREIPVRDSLRNPLNPGVIHDIAVTIDGLIVLAADNGIFWAPVVTAASPTYVFKRAVDSPGIPSGRYSAVAASRSSDLPVAVGAEQRTGMTTPQPFGLFFGKRTATDLELHLAQVNPATVVPSNMFRISIASCAGDRSIMYAVAGGSNDGMYCILRSRDGGLLWDVVGSKVNGNDRQKLFGDTTDVAGGLQWYSNCIAVSTAAPTPTAPEKVAVGWTNGYFTSVDQGTSWDEIPSTSEGLHADFQGLRFDRNDAAQNTIYVCSDGGIAITNDLGHKHSSLCNRHLPNLQLYRGAHGDRTGSLLAISMQDNGNRSCVLYPQTQPWKEIEGNVDGRLVAFIRNGQLLSYSNNEGTPAGVHEFRFDPAKEIFKSSLGIIPLAGAPSGAGLTLTENLITAARPWWGGVDQIWPLEAVNTPTWKNADNEPLVATAGSGGSVFGLFMGKTDHDLRWDLLGSFVPQMNETIFSVVLQLDPSQEWNPVASNPPTFLGLSAEDYTGIETDWTWSFTAAPRRIFVTSDTNVYSSGDNGRTWTTLVRGLPRTPHCVDLRFAREDSGATWLYLATYGWSIQRLLLNATPGPLRTVVLDPGETFILVEHGGGDDTDTQAISRREAQINVLAPVQTMRVLHAFENITITMSVRVQYVVDDSVRVAYHLILHNSDDGGGADTNGSFVLQPFETHKEVASVGYVGDSGSAIFTMTHAM